MLQIISGKFFECNERYRHQGRGILFSNYSWVRPIETRVGALEPVDSYRAVSSYVFSYINQIEKQEGPGTLVRIGDPEIVRQFQLLCILGLRAYFTDDRADVLTNCRPRPTSASDRYVPRRFASRIFDDQIRGSVAETDAFVGLVDRAIGMPRKRYSALISALENLDHALQVLNWNLDLAYSILVYCLESLSQTLGEYVAVWKDYDESVRSDLDRLLSKVDGDVAGKIRETLLTATHQKLGARFIAFIELHINDAFFVEPRAGTSGALRRTDLRRALRNAYRLRSGYVHRLSKIREQLHHPEIAEGDVFQWEHEPYLTFNGLLRAVFHVLCQFVDQSPTIEKEAFAWRSDLPGTIQLQAAPEHWIWQHEGLESATPDERSRRIASTLGGLLEHLLHVLATPGKAITDMRPLLTLYEKLIPQASKVDRIRMLVIYLALRAFG